MEYTKETEAEVLRVYLVMWETYFSCDLSIFESLIDDDFKLIGTSETEICNNKAEGIEYFKSLTAELVGKTEFRNRKIEITPVEQMMLVSEMADIYALVENEMLYYSSIRISTFLRNTSTGWKVLHQHGSFPDMRVQEGETLAIEKISRENIELRDAVKRHTIELIEKNRELELETSLERVRAVALSMRKPEDLTSICKVLFEELRNLKIEGLRNAMINIHDDEKERFVNYDYSDTIGKSINHLTYTTHPVVEKQIRQIRSSNDAFSHTVFSGNELEEWKTFRSEIGEKDDPRMNETEALHYYFYSIGTGAIGISTFTELEDNQLDVLKRFRNVFEFAYRRYHDVAQAEEQAREAQIELALERVRARAMAMQKSDELRELVAVIYDQLRQLGFTYGACGIVIMDEASGDMDWWMSGFGEEGYLESYHIPFFNHRFYLEQLNHWKEGKKFAVMEVSGEEKKAYDDVIFNQSEFSRITPEAKKIMSGFEKVIFSNAYMKHGALSWGTEPIDEDHAKILQRFAIVFEQSYTRFLDLQKAEDQAREARIEAALERVRSRTMGMQKSDELKAVIQIIYDQFVHLGINTEHAGIIMDYKQRDDMHIWIADSVESPSQVTIPYFDSPHWNGFIYAKENGTNFFAVKLNFEEKNNFYRKLFTYIPDLPVASKKVILNYPGLAISTVLMEDVSLYIENFAGKPYSDEDNSTLLRFGKVFQQTYTRFKDLETAEAQARESQIQLALERVRARTMAMQKSGELAEVSSLLFQQLKSLGLSSYSSGFTIWDNEKKDLISWMCNADGSMNPPFVMPIAGEPWHISQYESWKNAEDFIVKDFSGDSMQSYFRYLRSFPSLDEAFGKSIAAGHPMPERQIHYVANFSHGNLLFITLEPCLEAQDIVKRFAKVFDQTYTRFLDLQKAEAQVREAQIEASLEKVRSRSLAMHKSEEIKEVVKTVLDRIRELDIEMNGGVSLVTFSTESKDLLHWIWIPEQFDEPLKAHLPYFDHIMFHDCNDGRAKGLELVAKIYSGEVKANYFNHIFKHTGFAIIPDEVKTWCLTQEWFGFSFAIQKHSGIFLNDYTGKFFSAETNDILIRFAKVFEQSYIRFLDLQKAESQARQAQIEVALEKVRSRALAMQQPEELVEVAQMLRLEMGVLGVEELEGSTIFIHTEKSEYAECWFAIKDSTQPGKKMIADYIRLGLNDTWVGRQMLQYFHSNETQASIQMIGAHRKEWMEYCYKLSPLLDGFYEGSIPDRIYHLYKFTNGAIGAASPGDISSESWDLLKRAASVFSLAYSRFKDLSQARFDLQQLKVEKRRAEDALTELKATQSQLIQAEKMASLGQLTAGIAHEIQNPLNFVNNFSEVSEELIVEALDIRQEAGENSPVVAELLTDIKANLAKINLHGKRADAIVKGMLQHSRSTTGSRELTDVNELVSEYVKLAFHAFSGKDNAIDVKLLTDFDPATGAMELAPQEIGRVLLNILNNAFYAVNDSKKNDPGFSPEVMVQTTKVRNGIEISVTDNGDGIPAAIVEKVFQPFFTTKPTGQGTGLGLSLSYDIVKAHGGEIKVKSLPGEGTTFSITLNADS